MQEYSAVSYDTSQQHKNTSASRTTKDVSDTHNMVYYLSSRNPFIDKHELYSLATGVTADESVNTDQAYRIYSYISPGAYKRKSAYFGIFLKLITVRL